MKKRKIFLAVFLAFVLLIGPISALAEVVLEPQVESSDLPEIERSGPIKNPFSEPVLPLDTSQLAVPSEQFETVTLGPNLIVNSSAESIGTNGLPNDWFKGGYGANNRVLTYPVTGLSGGKGLNVSITNYTSGDAKWYFSDVPVSSGKFYQFSDYYLSDTPSILTARYTMSNGSFVYVDLATLVPQSSFAQKTVEFTPPVGAVAVTIFHLLKQNGNLTTDQFSLNEVVTSPPDETNLISNPSLEQLGEFGRPAGWLKGGYGTNARLLTYPVNGVGGTKAIKVEITDSGSGDAKWYFAPVSLAPGNYTYANQYSSNIPSFLTVQFQHSNGSYSYRDVASLPMSTSFTTASADFTVPIGVEKVTVFHLIKSVGHLTIDNVSLRAKTSNGGVFDTGAVTLRFDDNRLPQLQNAVPKLNSAGFKATFFVTSQQISDNGFTGYMSKAQIINLANQGHEIGSHTRTHAKLTSLTAVGQKNEIEGSRQDLLTWNVGSVNNFAYPFGDYNAESIQIVRDAGYDSAVATIDGYVSPNSDLYQLERQSVESGTTIAQIKQWIDYAETNKRWLILTFHGIDNTGERYSTTPAIFNQVVDYLVQKQIPVVTVAEVLESL